MVTNLVVLVVMVVAVVMMHDGYVSIGGGSGGSSCSLLEMVVVVWWQFWQCGGSFGSVVVAVNDLQWLRVWMGEGRTFLRDLCGLGP